MKKVGNRRCNFFICPALVLLSFSGNPAVVCPLDTWLPDSIMQSIAMENNLAATTFLVKDKKDGYQIRWFTPTSEDDICGHGTLAAAFVLFRASAQIGNKW